MKCSMTRRSLLRRAGLAAVTAPLVLHETVFGGMKRRSPNDRINVAVLGLKKMGRGHVDVLLAHRETQIVAVCDVDRTAREETRDKVEAYYAALRTDGRYVGCTAYNEYERIMERPDVDAVVVAVPDHWHAIMAVAASRAGKDVYCEKPLSLTVREAREMVRAARRYGTVFQTGSQQRSDARFCKACELVRSGYIGVIREVHVGVGPPSEVIELPPEPIPTGFDYDRWLGPAPWAPYNQLRCGSYYEDGWRRIRDYSGGKMTDWGAHHFDIAQWGLGMDGSGPVEIIPPLDRHRADLTYVYANGARMIKNDVDGVRFIGDQGWVEVNRDHLQTYPESLMRQRIQPNDVYLPVSPGHHTDWLRCIRSRRRPLCDVEIGCSSAIVCHLGNIAFWTGRTIRWDPVTEAILGDQAASLWLDRPKRAPYRL